MTTLWMDIRYALRGYRKQPLFTGAVLAIVAIGIGANSAIFSVVNAVLLRPLDYPRSAELVSLFQVGADSGARRSISPPDYFDLQGETKTIARLAAYWTPSVNIGGGSGEPEKALAVTCSHDLFRVLGVDAAIGRGFTADDDVPGATRVAVLGDGLWKRRFGGDPTVAGREILLDGVATTIVGVMPAGFAFPVTGTELWVPLRLSRTQPPNPAIPPDRYRQYRILNVVGRLQPGASLDRSRAEVGAIAARLAREFPESNGHTSMTAVALQDTAVGSVRPALLVLMAAVGALLLVACANVGSLLLVRAAGRSREMTIRMALGANRARLVRQMMTESLVLAAGGGLAGLLAAAWALDLIVRLAPAGIPRFERVRLDAAAVSFTFAAALLSGLIFGMAPALQIRAQKLRHALAASGRGLVGSAQRTRELLVVGEIALSMVLLIAAGLLMQTFVHMRRVDLGFRPAAALTIDRIELPRRRATPAATAAFFDQLARNVAAIPGVESSGLTLGLPLDARARFFVDESPFVVAGQPLLPAAVRPRAPVHVVSAGYFSAIGVPLHRGRFFTDGDRPLTKGVAIVNETFARRFFPNADPIGQRISHDLSIVPDQITTREIVGVVGDVRHFGLDQPLEAQIFLPHAQMPWPSMAVVVRTSLEPAQLSASIRRAVSTLDPTIPVPAARPMLQAFDDAVAPPRLRAWLLGVFASIAILLAVAGLYATMAYAVQQRTREIGLRIALGATPAQATAPLLRNGLTLAAAGIAVGVAGAAAVSRALATMLFGVSPYDPVTFVAVPAALAAVALVACYVPALRARRLDPAHAINAE